MKTTNYIIKKIILNGTSFLCLILLLNVFVYSQQWEGFTDLDEFLKAVEQDVIDAGFEYDDGSGWGNGATNTPNQKQKETPSEKKEIKTCSHDYQSKITKEPTCSEDGVMTFTCSKCKDTYTEVIKATGKHNYEEKVTKEPSCTENGKKTFICSVCGKTYDEEIPKLQHNYEEKVVKEASCTENGEKEKICTLCGDVIKEEIKAIGHSEGEWEITKSPGLFNKGEQIKKCVNCGEILQTETLDSKYPETVLYAIIGICVLILAVICFVIYKKKKGK